ncbi:unnamed protein product [Phytophthora lilii]|uniref:Unnamed protein product n=1 Tax=Phytophthora lilii TaxID=2077276 RepID=A0A9W6U844_9STRA|nr:unnamed protein product [Phytophthora lilii]
MSANRYEIATATSAGKNVQLAQDDYAPDPSGSHCTLRCEEEEKRGAAGDAKDSEDEPDDEDWSKNEYKADEALTCRADPPSDTAVIVMDFSQTLTVPSVSSTPSQWYFCSLVNVNVFGIYCQNDGVQTNYVYDETTSGKGSEQINSMLHHYIRTVILPTAKKKLIVYADNCAGQNNPVIKFRLAQVHVGVLDRIDYKFFVKGHTKNHMIADLDTSAMIQSIRPQLQNKKRTPKVPSKHVVSTSDGCHCPRECCPARTRCCYRQRFNVPEEVILTCFQFEFCKIEITTGSAA